MNLRSSVIRIVVGFVGAYFLLSGGFDLVITLLSLEAAPAESLGAATASFVIVLLGFVALYYGLTGQRIQNRRSENAG